MDINIVLHGSQVGRTIDIDKNEYLDIYTHIVNECVVHRSLEKRPNSVIECV